MNSHWSDAKEGKLAPVAESLKKAKDKLALATEAKRTCIYGRTGDKGHTLS